MGGSSRARGTLAPGASDTEVIEAVTTACQTATPLANRRQLSGDAPPN